MADQQDHEANQEDRPKTLQGMPDLKPRSTARKSVRYTVFERIGTGGMATVHRALEQHADGTERTVAIKRLWPHLAEDDEFTQSFVREARMAARLDHPNIVRIFKLGRARTGYFIAMEHVAGRDLSKILKHASRRASTPPIGVVLSLLCELCDALEYAHQRADKNGEPLGLIHRDVSPSNLLVDDQGHLKIIDFGIAKATSSNEQTRTGIVKGKYSYMAPEAIEGRKIDARSDLFAVGVVAHELLTARPLFGRGNDYQTIRRVQRAEVWPPSTHNSLCPPDLDAIVLRALAKEPEERWQSAAALREALEQVRESCAPRATAREVVEWLQALFAAEAEDQEPEELIIEETSDPRDEDETEIFEKEPAPRPAMPLRAPTLTLVRESQLASCLDPAGAHSSEETPAAPALSAVRGSAGRPRAASVRVFGANIRPPRFSFSRRTAAAAGVTAALAASVLLAPQFDVVTGSANYGLRAESGPGDHEAAVPPPRVGRPKIAVPIVEPIEPSPTADSPSPAQAPVEPTVTESTADSPSLVEAPVEPTRRSRRSRHHHTDRSSARVEREEPAGRSVSRESAIAAAANPADLDLEVITPPLAPVAKKSRPRVVLPNQVDKLSGEVPSLVSSRKQGKLPSRLSAKLCISDAGKVTSVTMLGALPSQIADELEAALRGWRYRPFEADGARVPVCFAVSFRTSARR